MDKDGKFIVIPKNREPIHPRKAPSEEPETEDKTNSKK
jgi:hypothetical protein